MIYNEFKELKLSALGFGAMRLPTIGNDPDGAIDEEKTAEMVEYAMKNGINYFDTAYGYHGGMSEVVMGKVLSGYPRESYSLADKFPGYDLENMGKVKEIFAEQLEKCGVDYFDFYLFHNVYEKNIDAYFDEKNGILEYLLQMKKEGKIKHLGCSVHGRYDTLKRFLDAYGEHMEFCQIQLNYLDWELQKAKDKVELLNQYGIPVWVMEPLHGGKLAKLHPEHQSVLESVRPGISAVEWALRFLQSTEGVTVTLSGMSTVEQLTDNMEIYETEKPLSEEEKSSLIEIGTKIVDALPCTACRYCVDHCPQQIDIPTVLSLYNERRYTNSIINHMAVGALPKGKRPADCIGCKSCEAVCPQQIKIAAAMADFSVKLNEEAIL